MKFDRNVDLVLIPANKNLDKVKCLASLKISSPKANKFKKVAKAKNIDFVNWKLWKS